ncbi:MAG: glycosyltransferase [Elusimicrobia bacterium]|nr:glycosyltransferase [Elusimicrobiota bacterium]
MTEAPRRILFVCTGNICRSAMAERILAHWSQERGLGLEVRSCGTAAESWYEVPDHARRLLAAEGAPPFKHAPQLVTRDHLRWADLVLVMTRAHRERLSEVYPEFGRKTRLLRELAGFGELDVDDPMGGTEEVFKRCLAVLKESLEALLQRGFAPVPEPDILVSVIVPTRDRADLLPRTLASVLAQTYRNFELIVVDDGSTDATESVVRAFADPRIRYERKGPPHSAAAARNHGVSLARGELIAFNDTGDDWLPEKLAVQVGAMARLPEDVAMGYSSLVRIHENGLVQGLDSPAFEADEKDRYRRALAMGVSGIYPQATLIRTKAFRELGGFDQSFRCWEDLEFFIRLAKRWRLQFIPGRFTRLFDDSRGVSRNLDAMYEAHRALLDKHAADLGGDPEMLVPHWRAIGIRMIPSKRGDRARESLWKVVRSGRAKPKDWAWLMLAYGGAPLYRALGAARRFVWTLKGAPPLDAR